MANNADLKRPKLLDYTDSASMLTVDIWILLLLSSNVQDLSLDVKHHNSKPGMTKSWHKAEPSEIFKR